MKPWPYPRLVAHRGGGKLAPENTLAAIRLGHAPRVPGGRVRREVLAAMASRCCSTTRRSTARRAVTGRSRSAPGRSWRRSTRAPGIASRFGASRWRAWPMRRALLRTLRMFANVEIKRIPGRHRECGERVAHAVAELLEGGGRGAAALVVFGRRAGRREGGGARRCRGAGSSRSPGTATWRPLATSTPPRSTSSTCSITPGAGCAGPRGGLPAARLDGERRCPGRGPRSPWGSTGSSPTTCGVRDALSRASLAERPCSIKALRAVLEAVLQELLPSP